MIRRYRLPIVMGDQLSGIVEAVGSRVRRFGLNDHVFARVDRDTMGAFAE